MTSDPTVTIRTILVPLDGTPFSERALQPAVAAARAFDARLELLHVADDETRGRDELERIAASLDLDDVVVGLHHASPEAALVGRIDAVDGPLVCMATHGHAGIASAVLGNLADRLVRDTTAPILLVGPDLDPGPGGWPPTGRGHLVLAYDSSAPADELVPLGVAFARAFGWDLHLAMVLHRHGSFLGDHDATRPRAHAEQQTAALVASGVAARLDVLDGLEPGHAICVLAETLPAAMVMVASHGGHTPVHAVFGSTATRIAHHAPCPVLVRRPA